MAGVLARRRLSLTFRTVLCDAEGPRSDAVGGLNEAVDDLLGAGLVEGDLQLVSPSTA